MVIEDDGILKKNPYDQKAYTYAQLYEKYKTSYAADSIRELWETKMTALPRKLLEVASEEQRADKARDCSTV